MPSSYEEIRDRKQPNTRVVPVALEPEPAFELAQARVDLDEVKRRTRMEVDEATARSKMEPNERAAKAVVRQAEESVRDAVSEAEKVVEARESAVQAVTHPWKVGGLNPVAYDELQAQHKPTKKQLEDAEEKGIGRPAWNADTFPIALLAACSIDPPLTVDQAKEMWHDDRWNEAEVYDLFLACRGVCEGRMVGEMGKDSAKTPTSKSAPTT